MLSRAQQLHDRARKVRVLAETAMTDEGRSILSEIAQRYELEASAAAASREDAALSEAAA